MRNVLILGATGGIGHWVTRMLCKIRDIKSTVYVRTPQKLDQLLSSQVKVIQGDVLDTDNLTKAMKQQDIVVAALSGDWLGQARSIKKAMEGHSISHIFWVTGLGIHHEVPGEIGKTLEYYVHNFPEYIESADTIENSGVSYTLVRAANLTNGNNMDYYIQIEGEPIHAENIDRCAVAKYIVDCISGVIDMNENSSVGVTN